mmetsp:Transcript_27435/g.84204  ORF Transcript_27435/g.84204 Transcript_27435/m.84204 type:complete len:604 (-) Transcript_27435:293-2104(-)
MKFDLSIEVGDGGVKEIRQRLYAEINREVRSFVRRYKLEDVTVSPNDGLASLRDVATVLKDTDPSAELFVLVDEYDRFANELMVLPDSSLYRGGGGAGESDVPGKDAGPLRGFLTSIKSLSGILPTRSFVTGVTPISLADASSANIYKSISFEKSVAGVFGFTDVDIKEGLSKLTHLGDDERKAAFAFMTEFFNGHLYYPTADETSKLYNPQLSMNFFQILCTNEGPRLLRAWAGGNVSVEDLVVRVDDPNTKVSENALELLVRSPLTFADIALLTSGGSIETKLSLIKMPFKLYEMTQLPSKDTEVLSDEQRARILAFMFAHGIVTIDHSRDVENGDEQNEDEDIIYLKVPNEVVRHKLLVSIESRLKSKVNADDFRATFQTPTEASLTTYFDKILDPMGTLLDNKFSESGVQAIFEATLRQARKRAKTGHISCEGRRQNADLSGRDGYSDILIVLSDVAVLLELKRVRPNAVCNSANTDIIKNTKFTSAVKWPRAKVAAFDDLIATFDPKDLKGLTVYFDNWGDYNDFLPGEKGIVGNRKARVEDYFDKADEQLKRYQPSAATYAQKLKAKKLYLFSAVNIGKRVLVRQSNNSPFELSSSS